MTFMELRHTVQFLEIDLDSMRNLKFSLENSLREVEACYTLQMEQLKWAPAAPGVTAGTDLGRGTAPGPVEALLNTKVKLEAEIATYRCLLEDGEDFSLGNALNSFNSMQSIQKTTTRQIVDGKVVSETRDTKVLRH
ncbi:Keratin, type I cytoskeletal 18 [Saguinus oedipus]|uniref:Keratin, type I cytoskeletal 18 n=1 Tax=Saguinus oedipus TaxID=9490 RepID=A0ABQ9TJ54_SAGOE|nr:Keratin, type I cytoskeletal 18 [Saguinus oedipus]